MSDSKTKVKELKTEKRNLINTFREEKDVLYQAFKKKLDAIDSQIKAQEKHFASTRAKTIKQVMGAVKKGKTLKGNEFDWNKVPEKKTKLSNKKR